LILEIGPDMKFLVLVLACVAYTSALSVKNCNNKALVTVSNVRVPDKLVIKTGNVINLGLTVRTRVPITNGLKISFKLTKKAGWFWIPVPCSVLKLCDVVVNCDKLKHTGLPCPGKPGTYQLKHSIKLPKIPKVPSILANGEYKFEGKVSVGGRSVGCINVQGKVEL